jgi:nucleoside-diphosphate kinase|tara:strand:- start:16 stop:417 length:402 start_codon:yes stop_codon:yes gene_type:complete
MGHEKSLGIIKPDAVERSLIGSIIKIIEDNNIKINQMKMIQLTSAMAEEFYFIHKDKPFYEKLISYMTSAPVVLMVLEGKDVVKRYRDLMGKTNPEEAAEGTIRKLYAIDTTFNSVHGSDSIENALAEISLFF